MADDQIKNLISLMNDFKDEDRGNDGGRETNRSTLTRQNQVSCNLG